MRHAKHIVIFSFLLFSCLTLLIYRDLLATNFSYAMLRVNLYTFGFTLLTLLAYVFLHNYTSWFREEEKKSGG